MSVFSHFLNKTALNQELKFQKITLFNPTPRKEILPTCQEHKYLVENKIEENAI